MHRLAVRKSIIDGSRSAPKLGALLLAASGARNFPPSENESSVMFRMPKMSGNRIPGFGSRNSPGAAIFRLLFSDI
jgi:hypothetical protein